MNGKLSLLKNGFLCVSFLISVSAWGQTRISDPDISRIRQKSIQKFLKARENDGVVYFEDFQASVNAQTITSGFGSNFHRFHLSVPLEKAWSAYLSAHPAKIWRGRVVSCGFIYSPGERTAIFPGDKYPGLATGQVFFIEMRILCRLVRFPVCFIVTEIDASQHAITFSYVSTGASQGAQILKLADDGHGGTTISHSSIHQTKNVLRDKLLYPIYHKKAIKEVHANIRKSFSQSLLE